LSKAQEVRSVSTLTKKASLGGLETRPCSQNEEIKLPVSSTAHSGHVPIYSE